MPWAVTATDDFNRADNASLGANWTNVSSGGFAANGMQIVSNSCTPESLGSDKLEMYTGVSFTADQYVQAKCSVTGTTAATGPAIYVRCASDGSGYRVSVSKSVANNVQLGKFVAGAFTTILNVTTTWVDNDILRLEVIATTLRIYQNGVQLGTDQADSALISGPPGIGYSATATSASLDDWEAGVPDARIAWIAA